MFRRIGKLWDVILFGFVILILASWQLRFALEGGVNVAEGILAVAAIIFGIGLLFTGKWGLIGMCITLTASTIVYFGEMWYLPIIAEDSALIWPSLWKLIAAILLFIYIGRQRIEERMAS